MRKRTNFLGMFVWAVVAVLLLCAAYTLWLRYSIPKLEERAHFGEAYGGLAALFSGLAFAGVIVAIAMQREELRLQRKELKLTRGELTRQAAAQESSSRAVESQVQLMIAGTKLHAEATLLTFYNNVRAADPGSDKAQELAKNVQKLLTEINLMSTHQDPPNRSR